MDPPLSHSAPSGHASLLTLRISRSLFLNVGPASEWTMADPRTQSDEMDAVSIDSDCAEPGAPDATGSFSILAFQSEPTTRVGLPNGQLERPADGRPEWRNPKRMRRPCRHL